MSRPSTSTTPAFGRSQPEHRLQQHGLAAARAADDAEDFARRTLEADAVVHDLRAEAVDDVAHARSRRGRSCAAPQKSISRKKIANSASAKITRKIDCTTATVVSRPSSREESRTCRPRNVPVNAISDAEDRRLDETRPERRRRDRFVEPCEKLRPRQVEQVAGQQAAARQAHEIRNDRQQRQRDHEPEHARQHQHFVRITPIDSARRSRH